MRRILAAMLAVSMFGLVTGPITCDGWQSSATARMACCLEAHDGCPDQSASDVCCSQSEQRQHTTAEQSSLVTASVTMPVAVALVSPLQFANAASAQAVTVLTRTRSNLARLHDPPSLTSVLLI